MRPERSSADLTAGENLLQTALNAGRLGALELRLPEYELEASDICIGFFGRKPGEPFTYTDLLEAIHPDDRARRLAVLDQALATGGDYSIEYRNVWPDGSQHWVDVRARAVRRPDGSIRSLGRRLLRHHRAKDGRNRARDIARPAGGRTNRARRIDRDPRTSRRAANGRSDQGCDRSREGAGAIAPGPEDGDHRPADRAASRTISTIC